MSYDSPEPVTLACNFSDAPVTVPVGGDLVYSFTNPEVTADSTTLEPWGFALIERTV